MGFLLRKRKKRQVKTKKGAICFKGYKYVYRIPRQGIQYLAFLDNPKARPAKPIYHPERIEDLIGLEWLRRELPLAEKEFAEEIHRALFDNYVPVGRYKRFPRKKSDWGLVTLIEYYRDKLTVEEEKNGVLKELVGLLKEKLNEKKSVLW